MTKAHELKLVLETFNAVANGQDYLILEQSEKVYERNDFILLIATNIGVETGQTLMTQIQYICSDDGLKDNYVLLKLKEVN